MIGTPSRAAKLHVRRMRKLVASRMATRRKVLIVNKRCSSLDERGGRGRASAGHPTQGAESSLMIVLGIDPGTANTGYGVVERRCGRLFALDGGVITTRPEAPMQIRLAATHRPGGRLLDEHLVKVVSMENLYFGKNVVSAFAVGPAPGVV